MKNKPLSAYKRKKLIESFCDELTATQAAHRLNLDRNTVNKYFKRIRECIAGYREYQKMNLMVHVMSRPEPRVHSVSKRIVSTQADEQGLPVRIMCIDGQLLTEVEQGANGQGSKYMMQMSTYFNGAASVNGGNGIPEVDCGDLDRLAEDFYEFTSRRLKKFFGIKSHYAYLYIKEAEFVFNVKEYAQREKLLYRMADQIFL